MPKYLVLIAFIAILLSGGCLKSKNCPTVNEVSGTPPDAIFGVYRNADRTAEHRQVYEIRRSNQKDLPFEISNGAAVPKKIGQIYNFDGIDLLFFKRCDGAFPFDVAKLKYGGGSPMSSTVLWVEVDFADSEYLVQHESGLFSQVANADHAESNATPENLSKFFNANVKSEGLWKGTPTRYNRVSR